MNNFPPIYPQHIHAKLEQKNSFGLHAVGSGPMRVVEFDSSTGMTLVKNPSYKGNSGKPAVQVGRARIDAVPDHQTQVARMIRGEQDLMYNVDKDQAESFAGNPDFKVDVQDAVSFNYVMFDAKARSGAKMFADKNVRLALEYAINRKALRQLLHKAVANAEPLDAVCHPKILHCAWSKKPPEFDPAKAKKLLADAGYPNGFDVEILTWGEARDTAEAVAGMWREVGVNASVNVQTFGAFVKTRSAGVPAIVTLWDNSVGQPDIDNTAEYFFLPNARNYNKDPELEKLALAGRRELDPKKRTEIYRRMFDGATEEAYLMPLQRIPAVIVHRKEVRLLGGTTHPKGFEINHVAWN
jgi:peptide/nickel transport system substrate-binding protein